MKSKEWKLPEKWCVKSIGEDEYKPLEKYLIEVDYSCPQWDGNNYYYHFHNEDSFANEVKSPGFTEITFDQFKRHVLNIKEEMNSKKLIGYKIKPEFESIRTSIAKALGTHSGNINNSEIFLPELGGVYDNAVKLKVLDIWFEPVFENEFKVGDWVVFEAQRVKKEYPELYTSFWNNDYVIRIDEIDGEHLMFRGQLSNSSFSNEAKCFRKATPEEIEKSKFPDVKIKGYPAEFGEFAVQFGCQTYTKEFVIALGNFLKNSGLKIEDKDQIMKVVEYYKNK